MTRRDYELVAAVLRHARSVEESHAAKSAFDRAEGVSVIGSIAAAFATRFAMTSSSFDVGRFMEAAGFGGKP